MRPARSAKKAPASDPASGSPTGIARVSCASASAIVSRSVLRLGEGGGDGDLGEASVEGAGGGLDPEPVDVAQERRGRLVGVGGDVSAEPARDATPGQVTYLTPLEQHLGAGRDSV